MYISVWLDRHRHPKEPETFHQILLKARQKCLTLTQSTGHQVRWERKALLRPTLQNEFQAPSHGKETQREAQQLR